MIFAWIFLLILAGFAAAVMFGAPYVPILKKEVDPILEALELKPGQTLIDLGCGDGRLLKAAAKRGIKGVGYEINPWLFIAAKINCWSQPKITIRFGNFWRVQLPEADAIFVFLIEHYMGKLEQFLAKQLKRPTRVVSYIYKLPTRHAQSEGRNFFVYRFP